jgi:hypothetical protein
MNRFKKFFSMALLGGSVLWLSACELINLPVTPLTLAGCWEGTSSLETIDARFDIRADEEPEHFVIDGNFSGLIDFDFQDYRVKLEGDELKPQGMSRLAPVTLRADNGRLIVTSLVPPTSFTMSRCR